MNKAVGLSHNGRGCLGSGLEFIIQFKCEGISLVGYWENMGPSGILTLIFHSNDSDK